MYFVFSVFFLLFLMQIDSEEPVFEAVINWVKHNKQHREKSLPQLLQYVRMPLLTPRYITDVIDSEVYGQRVAVLIDILLYVVLYLTTF